MSAVKNGAVYLLGQVPSPVCTTTGRPDGTGVITGICGGATDKAGNKAALVTARYRVVYALGGFISPRPGAKLNPATRKITVRFRLTNAAGVAIPASTAAALASTYYVRNASAKEFQRSITRPRHIRSGRTHKYSITVTENVGGGFLTAPPDALSQNPESVYFG